MQNEVIDRGWGGIRLVIEATRFVNDIRSLSSALDQVADYIVLYNESRETNSYKHNVLLQNKCSLYLQNYNLA